MAVRACSSIIKNRQDAAVAAGAVPLLVAVLSGCHQSDKETCLRTSQCVIGMADKNPDVQAAFRDTGAVSALESVVELYGHPDIMKAHAVVQGK
jgi:hypothetical protein